MKLFSFLKMAVGQKIVVYADFIDPFCYIGFHSLRLLAEARGLALDWRGFEFNPGTPPEGLLLETAANSDLRPGMWASVQEFAQRAGLDFPEPHRVPNTRGAHALVQGVKKPDVKNPLIERIYQAYFMKQQDIGQIEVLIDLAGAFEISADEVHAALSNPRVATTLEANRGAAQQRGFLGMPGFIYRGKNYFGALSKNAWENILGGLTS